jgi:hypothetical protein
MKMAEIDIKEKVATLLNDLAKRAPTTAFEQAINAERKREVPAQCYPKYPPLPATNSSNQWLDGNKEPPIDATNCK